MTSKKRKRPAERETGCCPVEVKAFDTPLSKLLLLDPIHPGMAIHDVDPFGVYQSNQDGKAVFRQVIRCAPSYVACKTPNDLDALIARVFLAAAKHSHRYMVVTKDHVRTFVRDGNLFSGSPIQDWKVEHTVVPALPPNVILCVTKGNPEELGKLCYSCGMYGVSLMFPHLVCAVEVVPAPFGYRQNTTELLT